MELPPDYEIETHVAVYKLLRTKNFRGQDLVTEFK